MILPAILLLACCASYLVFLRGDVFARTARAGLIAWDSRRARFAMWCIKALVLFGLVGIASLAVLGNMGAVLVMPAAFADARMLAVRYLGDGRGFPIGLMLGAMLGGGVVGELIGWLRRSRKPFMLGDIGVLMPRDTAELGWGVALSVIAGVVEEIFFRLTVPLLIALVTGSGIAGFGVGLVMFAMAHRYQGWLGVGATAVVGALMTLLYLTSGHLWLAMLVHGFIDLNGLVVRPLLRGALPRRA